jgi:hypothetical protein
LFLDVSDLRRGIGRAEVQPPIDNAASAVVRRVESLMHDGDTRGARELIEEALSTGADDLGLQWALAELELADGQTEAGMCRLDAAVEASGRDAAAVGRQIRILHQEGLWREALHEIESISSELGGDPLVRAEVGSFYRSCGCYAHATQGYGPPNDLPGRVVVVCSWCWLCSGGPSGQLRRKAWAWEESELLGWLRRGERFADLLDTIPGLDGRAVRFLRSQIETLTYRWRHHSAAWMAVGRALYRLLPTGVLAAWLVFWVIIHQARFVSGSAGAAAGSALSAAVASAVVVATIVCGMRPDLQPRFNLRISVRGIVALFFTAAVFEAAIGEGYEHRVLPLFGWWSCVVLGLVAVPAFLACALATALSFSVMWAILSRRLIREDCVLQVLAVLLELLDDLRAFPARYQLGPAIDHARYLEFAARRFDRDLLPASSVDGLGSGDWLTRRAAGWAEALRHVERQIVAPVPGSRAKVEAALVHEIRCLATGDLGALAWRQPPPRPSRRTVLRQHAVTAARTILVAALPLAAVLAAQPILHEAPGVFGWARIATATWALLYIVLSLDPAIRDKIDTASQVVGVLRNPRSTN